MHTYAARLRSRLGTRLVLVEAESKSAVSQAWIAIDSQFGPYNPNEHLVAVYAIEDYRSPDDTNSDSDSDSDDCCDYCNETLNACDYNGLRHS